MFEKISSKTKIFFGAIAGIFSFILFIVLGRKVNSKKILEIELEKVKKELEVEYLSEEISENKEKINTLENKKEDIKKRIREIEDTEIEEEVTKEELDDFFDSRGF